MDNMKVLLGFGAVCLALVTVPSALADPCSNFVGATIDENCRNGSYVSLNLAESYVLQPTRSPPNSMCHINMPVWVTALGGYEVNVKILANGAVAGVAYNVKTKSLKEADVVWVDTGNLAGGNCLGTGYIQSASGMLKSSDTAYVPCPVQVRAGAWIHLKIQVEVGSADIYYEGQYAVSVSTQGLTASKMAVVTMNGQSQAAELIDAFVYDMAQNTTSCPDGWTHHQKSASCYYAVHDWWPYDEAYEHCIANHSATLLKVDDEIEMDFLDNWLFYNYEDHWTSATDYDQDGTYGWNNDTEPVGYQHWFLRGPPHEDDGECMYILKNIYWEGWYMNRFEYEDYNCTETKHFICEKPAIQCPAPYTIRNAKANSDLVHLGSTVVYDCNVGHEFPDGLETKSIICMQKDNVDGKWNCEPNDCQLKVCPEITHIENAEFSTDALTYGTELTITCDPGWIFPDQNVSQLIRCEDNRNWTFVPDNCQRVECPDIPIYSNITYNGTGITYETEIVMTCDPWYMYPDRSIERTLVCTKYANWSVDPIPCIDLNCTELNYDYVTVSSSNNSMNTVVELSCIPGYEWSPPLNASFHRVQCMRRARWNTTLPDCHPLTCPAIPGYFGVMDNNTEYGTELHLQCQDGDIFSDQTYSLSTRCGTTGNWYPLALECYEEIDLKEFYGRPPAEAPAAAVIGTMQIIIMLAALALIIFMDVDTFYRSRHWIRRNWRDARWRVEQQREKIWREEDPDDFNTW